MDNQNSYWYVRQSVTRPNMQVPFQDIYSRFGYLTQNGAPCILNLENFTGTLSQSGSNIDVPAGSFRFADTHYDFLLYDAPIYGNAVAATITVTGNGFIVAHYDIHPSIEDQTDYYFPTSYSFVASATVYDCIVAEITGGIITGYGNFLINDRTNSSELTNLASHVALTPADIPAIGVKLYPSITNDDFTNLAFYTISDSDTNYKSIGRFIKFASGDAANGTMQFINSSFKGSGTDITGNAISQLLSFRDAGNSNAYPDYQLYAQTGDGYVGRFLIARNPVAASYNGYNLLIESMCSNGTTASLNLGVDADANGFASWYLYDTDTLSQNTGFTLKFDKRPYAVGDYNAFVNTNSSVAVMGDSYYSHSTVYSYGQTVMIQRLTDNTAIVTASGCVLVPVTPGAGNHEVSFQLSNFTSIGLGYSGLSAVIGNHYGSASPIFLTTDTAQLLSMYVKALDTTTDLTIGVESGISSTLTGNISICFNITFRATLV